MERKGWEETDQQPDVLLGYNVMVEKAVKKETEPGTLTVNMVFPKNNKLIWQGWSTGDITSKNVTRKEVKKDVKSILKKFDLPKINS